MTNIHAIILAGGYGLRLGYDIPKQFVKLNGKPIIVWSLEKFNRLHEISNVIVVAPDEYKNLCKEIVSKYKISKLIKIVPGGKTRQESSYNAIYSMNFNDNDILLFHDAARPFIKEDIIEKCIKDAKTYGAAGIYVKAVDTIAEVENGYLKSILDRNKVYQTQTPQAFRYSIIKNAHEIAKARYVSNVTDDITLVIEAGYKVKIIEGDYNNIKITNPIDFEIAELIATKNKDRC